MFRLDRSLSHLLGLLQAGRGIADYYSVYKCTSARNMPDNLRIGVFAFGAVLTLVALLGGNFKFFGAEVASTVSNPILRFVAFALGAMLVALAIHGYHFDESSAPPSSSSSPSELETPSTSPFPPQTAAVSPGPSSTSQERWEMMGASPKTGEQVYLDRSSISRSGALIGFNYKIGNDVLEAKADCDSNRWSAINKVTRADYGWNSPQSEATQSMMNNVCSNP